METQFPEVFALDPAAKLNLIGELWDSLEETRAELPVPDGLLEELDRRHAEHVKDPSRAVPWEDVIAQLKQRRAERKHG
jgi:putative addiction module component (TIGR02574 family)